MNRSTSWKESRSMQIAVNTFDDHTDAQRAVDRLVHAGFRRMDLHIEVDPDSRSNPSSGSDLPDREPNRSVLSSIGFAFVSLFGHDNPHHEVHGYTEVVRRGHSVVMVYVENDEEAARAAQVMNDRSGVPADRRAAPWRPSTRYGATGNHANAG
jgi:hypothetical protein